MRILVLSWEFPPRIVGGIARHVAELYPELVNLGQEIHLLTIEVEQSPAYEQVEGIHVYRVNVGSSHNFLHWVDGMNVSMEAAGCELINRYGSFDLIHAHDWLVGDSAIALKHRFKIPLITTIHATEYGRQNGIYTDVHRHIHGKEKSLAYNSWRIIVCSEYMRREVSYALANPIDKIDVIYNGIRPEKKRHHPDLDFWAFRRRFAQDHERIVYYVGRMTYEKGISVLLNAAPRVFREMDNHVRLILIGGGGTEHLKQQAWDRGIADRCNFTGFMSETDLDRFQTIADCAVFPSLYEPFGIVALESFAARVPVIVSDTGGFPEVVTHNKTGVVTRTNDPESLASGILEILKNPDYARWLIDNAYVELERRFNWAKLAEQTEKVYQRVVQERAAVVWV